MIEINQTNKIVVLGIAVPTALGLLYFLWRTSKDDDEDYDEDKQSIATSHQTVIEVPIPRKVVGTIIGRQGANIKELQERTGVRMNFKEVAKEDENDRCLVIRGSAAAAQAAECLIREMIADLPVNVKEEMKVPKYAVGRIIGRGGETVRQLSRTSQCKIFIDRSRGGNPQQPHLITLTGSKDQILMAKGLIQELVEEEDQQRAKLAVSAANRETRESRIKTEDSDMKPSSEVMNQCEDNETEDWDKEHTGDNYLYLEFPKEKKHVEVYVSAVADLAHFWVQTIGPMALQLDHLSQQMTAFYENEGQKLKISSVKKGDIIAAPFENDYTWYRAKVMDVKDSQLDVFYVDYGDSAYIDSTCARAIREEFLTLPFQAIECCLSGVKPSGEWSEAAFEKFETLTHCAKWKVVVAEATQFSGSIPHLVLVDTNDSKDVNINEELIRSGYAVSDP